MTHDILTPFITSGKVPAFKLRTVPATTLSPTWGTYSGCELTGSTPRPGYEEQIDNERCEYKPCGFAAAHRDGIEDLLTHLDATRIAHPALCQLWDIYSHPTSDDQILAYPKRMDTFHSPTGGGDAILMMVNLDPYGARADEVCLNLEALGLPGWVDALCPVVRVADALTGDSYEWPGQSYVHLGPFAGQVAHVFSMEPS